MKIFSLIIRKLILQSKRLKACVVAVLAIASALHAGTPVMKVGADRPEKGLADRNIALWNSHGAYYNADKDKWIFQRAPLNTTVEDVYTSTYVLDLLIPMLENAGAYVMIPRERDTSDMEVIVDNGDGEINAIGDWRPVVGYGWDATSRIAGNENPMISGDALVADATSGSRAKWTIDVDKGGTYSLYVSYPKQSNASARARYKVTSLRGEEEYIVDQTMGAGTWVRIDEFPVRAGEGSLTVEIIGGDGDKMTIGADAVRLGGGMGNVAREGKTSGHRRWTEGARYWLQWAGFPQEVWQPEESTTDYTDDIRCRPHWVNYLSGGSTKNPRQPGLGVPVDLAVALHTDAGTTPDTAIVGTLGIYSTDGGSRLGDGRSRATNRLLTESVVAQITSDLRALYQSDWTQRKIRDKRYIEARIPKVPSTLIELLSHQNYADMTLGLDPQFRFDASRAIYKGILRYLYSGSRKSPIVQPLPPRSFAMETTAEGSVRLSWLATEDPLEPSATPKDYIVQRRIGADGAFVDCAITGSTEIDLDYPAETIVSYRIVARNEGGRSFPSEALALGWWGSGKPQVMIVNGFTRVGAPEQFDDGEKAGFLDGIDSGVPFVRNVGYIGSQYDFDRDSEWVSDDEHPGHGASYTDNAGRPVAGNTFDFAVVHGEAMMMAEQSFVSESLEGYLRLCSGSNPPQPAVVDLILGKQRESIRGNDPTTTRYKTFPVELQRVLRRYLSRGGALIVSGSSVASDLLANAYSNDSTELADRQFAQEVLGIDLIEQFGATSGKIDVTEWWGNKHRSPTIDYSSLPNELRYVVDSPDAISSTRAGATTLARYSENQLSAAVLVPEGNGYGAVAAYGFPLESVTDMRELSSLINAALRYLSPWRPPMAPQYVAPSPKPQTIETPQPENDPVKLHLQPALNEY